MARYSSRIHWESSANRLSEMLARKRGAGVRILDLTESNPTAAGLTYPDTLLTALADPRSRRYDPSPLGLPEARAAVSEYYEGVVAPEQILLTASTSEAYTYAFKLLCNPGDEVLVPRPSYPLFDYLGALECVKSVQYPLFYNHGWTVDVQALREFITDRTRAIVFVNPNNPTGSFLKRPEYDAVVELCHEHSLAIICDEVFSDYAFAPDAQRMRTLSNTGDVLTLCMSGLSKVSGLPQMKLGWIAAVGPKAEVRRALERLELIADTFLNVATSVQYAAPALLNVRFEIQSQIRARTAGNLAWLRTAIAGSAMRILDVEGGWYATVQVPRIETEEEWVLRLLDEHHVLVQPGFFYDFDSEAFLVLSMLTPEPEFREGVERLCSIM